MDIRYSFRMMRRNAGVTSAAVLTLALGIGANTAVFSLLYAVLLRPLPYKNPERLVHIWGQNLGRGIPFHFVAYPDFAQWREQSRSFDALSAYRPDSMSLSGRETPESVSVLRVNAEFLAVAGRTVIHGRDISPEDDRPGAAAVALLSHALWQRIYGSDPSIVGRSILLDGRSSEVIGVLPADFALGGTRVDLYVPLAASGAYNPASLSVSVGAYGRLNAGAGIPQAQAELDTICRRLEQEHPPMKRDVRVWGLREFMVRNERTGILILMGAVAFVLLIACANVANILLARAGGRSKEMALRALLGASRLRLLRQVLTESVLLSIAGGALGVLLAFWGVQTLVRTSGRVFPLIQSVTIDLRVLCFAVVVSFFTGLLAGMAPARAVLRECSSGLWQRALKEGGRTSAGADSGKRLRSVLVVSEVALALVLLIAAGLLIRSLGRLMEVNPGFSGHSVLTARITLPLEKYPSPQKRALFYQEFVEKLRATPAAEASGIVSALPLSGTNTGVGIRIAGRPEPPSGEAPIVWWRAATSGYFRAMSIPLLKGRLFTDQDQSGSPAVALVNETLARRLWPGEDPVGKQFSSGRRGPGGELDWVTIVGIVGDVRHTSLAQEPDAEFFVPYSQLPYATAWIAVRTHSDPAQFAPMLRNAAIAVAKDQPVSDIRTMEQLLGDSTHMRTLYMRLVALFAAVALFLAAIGIYGVVSYVVSLRTHEIGVRMTLGAGAAQMLATVIGRAMVLVSAGVALGLGAAWAAGRLLSSQLFGVGPGDPLIFAVAPAILALVAFLAAYVPARRAARMDPMVALRQE
jgi:putative ABC transport system permease protein